MSSFCSFPDVNSNPSNAPTVSAQDRREHSPCFLVASSPAPGEPGRGSWSGQRAREYMHTASAPPSRAAMPRAKREVPCRWASPVTVTPPGLGGPCFHECSKDTTSLTYIMHVWVGPLPALGPLHPAWGRVQCKSRVAVLLMGTPRAVPVHSTSLPCVAGLSSAATCVCMVSLLYLGETLCVYRNKSVAQ